MGARLLVALALVAVALLQPSPAGGAPGQSIALPNWNRSDWWRGCASLDLDFYNDRYYINSNTTCDGTTGTQYSSGSGNTGVQNFINGSGATFSRNSIGTYFNNSGVLTQAPVN